MESILRQSVRSLFALAVCFHANFLSHLEIERGTRFVDRDMFMRYQYGMSVGHVYMHSLFPLPTLPSIPPDFDYCLQDTPHPVSHEPEQAQSSSSNVTLSPDFTFTESPDPFIMDQGMTHDDEYNDMDQENAYEHADHDYLDDMDDREILMHEEMYGEI